MVRRQTPAPLDTLDRRLINALQGGFPLVEAPYRAVAERLCIDEAEVLDRLRRLLDEGVLTRFGPMFQVERMGGRFMLAALSAPEASFDAVAEQVNALPEVAHNYRRESERHTPFNMWFVLATESEEGIAAALRRIEEGSGLPVFAFPKRREYFVEMKLEVRR